MDEAKVDSLIQQLEQLRNDRLDDLPQGGTMNDYIADAMNALQLAFIIINGHEPYATPPQVPTFTPVSGMLKRDAP